MTGTTTQTTAPRRTTNTVRVLPPDFPHLPPPVPQLGDTGRYDPRPACYDRLPWPSLTPDQQRQVQEAYDGPEDVSDLLCTRLAHDEDEHHVCHLLHSSNSGDRVLNVVWGGE